MPSADVSLIRQLAANSNPYRDPLTAIDWSQLNTDSFWLPQPALSLYGLAEYGTLSEAVKKRLSQYEFLNIACCGLWLESLFLRRTAGRLDPVLPSAEYAYCLHEIREEAGHSLMLMQVIEKSGLPLPAGAWRKPRLADFAARHLPANGALYWLATVITEELPDRLNRYVRSHAQEALNPAIRQMCTLHVIDEARHIAFAREQLDAMLAGRRVAWCAPLVNLLLREFGAALYFPGAAFYELAGLTHGAWWCRMARRNPARALFVRECMGPTLRLLETYGIRLRPD